jgi:hypothetical protein
MKSSRQLDADLARALVAAKADEILAAEVDLTRLRTYERNLRSSRDLSDRDRASGIRLKIADAERALAVLHTELKRHQAALGIKGDP